MLPAGDIAELYEFDVSDDLFHQGGTLHVRYRQACRGEFRYTLATGAYWRGPIERLAPTRAGAGTLAWDLAAIEPSGELRLALRAPPDRQGAPGVTQPRCVK